tara:strand:+ start:208 stop:504 length:297 start_codon:yes stop_codon:yes gene_type:complete
MVTAWARMQASDMFRAFDTDTDGQLDKAEFLQLLQQVLPQHRTKQHRTAVGSKQSTHSASILAVQVFPQHCDEIEQMFDGVFEAADADHSGNVSFGEP